jgi:hypothetical protein
MTGEERFASMLFLLSRGFGGEVGEMAGKDSLRTGLDCEVRFELPEGVLR